MDEMRLAERMSSILYEHDFDIAPEELIRFYSGSDRPLDLVGYVPGSAADVPSERIEDVFSKEELTELEGLAAELDVLLPEQCSYE